MIRFPQITFLHGRGEPPGRSTEKLEAVLRETHPMVEYARPFIPDSDTVKALEWVERFYLYRIRQNSLLVGVERGGLIACAVQSAIPVLRLSVIAINAPTEDDKVVVEPCEPHTRVALYSSAYEPIKGRCDWKEHTSLAYDVDWLAGGCKNFYPLAYLISAFSRGAGMDKEVSMMFPPRP